METKDCNHILGYDDGYGQQYDGEEFEPPTLIYANNCEKTEDGNGWRVLYASIRFHYCPMCGERYIF